MRSPSEMNDMSVPGTSFVHTECPTHPCEDGQTKKKSKSYSRQETNAGFRPEMLNACSVERERNQTDRCVPESSTPECQATNNASLAISSGKCALQLKGIPITRSFEMSGLGSISAARGSGKYWTESKGALFQNLLWPRGTGFVDSHLTWSNGSASATTHASWFLVRTLKATPSLSHPTSWPSQRCLLANITVEEDIGAEEFLLKRNEAHRKTQDKALAKKAGQLLKKNEKISADDKRTMDEAALKEKLEAKKRLIDERKHSIDIGEKRTRLYRLHGSKEQYTFLRQQRGIYRYVYNKCVSSHIEAKATNAELDEKTMRAKFEPDQAWKDREQEWGLAAPNHLRVRAIADFSSNYASAKTNSRLKGNTFRMGFLSKKDDKRKFNIPIHKQQINALTGSHSQDIPHRKRSKRARRRKQRNKRKRKNKRKRASRTAKKEQPKRKTIVFQYMSRRCPGNGVFTINVSNRDEFPTSADAFGHGPEFVYKSGVWYLAVTSTKSIPPAPSHSGEPQKLRVCSIDPGVKTFLTVYDPQDGSITEIGTSKDSLARIKNPNSKLSTHARLERLRRIESRTMSRLSNLKKELVESGKSGAGLRKLKHLIKRVQANKLGRIRAKRASLVREMHYKAAKYLTRNYDVIMMPYFDTKGMMEQKGRMRRKTKRAMRDLNFSAFRSRLMTSAENQGVTWLEVGEAYTSRQCVACGTVNTHLTCKDRMVVCRNNECGLSMARDAHGAIAIFVRNAFV